MKERSNYLIDFPGRVLSLGIPYKLAQYAEKNVLAYRDKKISSSTFYQIMHFVLLYIEDCAIKSKKCTRDDIVSELEYICEEILKIEGFDTYREMTVDIIENCFLGGGRGISFESFNGRDNIFSNFKIDLIAEEFVKENGVLESSYTLTPQGFKYIYLTKELEDLSEVEIEQIKLFKAVRDGNLKVAKINIDNLFHKVEIQRKNIEYDKKFILTEIMSVDLEKVSANIATSYELINNQRRENDNILKLIKEYHAMDKTKNIALWQKIQNDLEDMIYIENKLNLILDKQLKLILQLQELGNVLDDTLLDVSFMSVDTKFNIMEDVIKPLEQELSGEFNPFEIVRGLFNFNIEKKYSPSQIFGRHEIFKDKPVEDKYDISYDDYENEEVDTTAVDKVNRYNKMYEDIFLEILTRVMDKGEITLEEILNETSLFTMDLAATKVVLVTLFNEQDIYFDEGEYTVSLNNWESFDPVFVAKKNGYTVGNKRLLIYRADEEDLIIEESGNEDFKNVLKVPNMMFVMRKGD